MAWLVKLVAAGIDGDGGRRRRRWQQPLTAAAVPQYGGVGEI